MKVLKEICNSTRDGEEYLVELSPGIGAVIRSNSWYKRTQWPSDIGMDARMWPSMFVESYRKEYSLEKIMCHEALDRGEITLEEWYKAVDEVESYKDDDLYNILREGRR